MTDVSKLEFIYKNHKDENIKNKICEKLYHHYISQTKYDKAIEWLTNRTNLTFQDYKNMGELYLQLRDIDNMMEAFKMCLHLNYDIENALYFAGIYKAIGYLFDSYQLYQSLSYIIPNNIKLLNNMAEIEMFFNTEMAIEKYKKAFEIEKNYAIYSNLIMNSVYHNHSTYLYHMNKYKGMLKYMFNKVDHQNEKIRIGYVSNEFLKSDLTKPVNCFVHHIMENHSDKFEVYGYFVNRTYIQQNSPAILEIKNVTMRNMSNMSISKIQETILEDKLNILIDLMNHTGGNVLEIYQKRLANKQISYCALPISTGIKTMDYKLVDKNCDTVYSSNYIEKILVMDGGSHCFVPTYPFPKRIDLSVYEEQLNGRKFIQLCSFANPKKITDYMLKIWCEIIFKLDNVKLYFRHSTYHASYVIEHMKKRIQKINDAVLSKVQFIGGFSDYTKVLELYNNIDLFLDTYPYSGTTTICEALMMGVPVITLNGNDIHERMGSSILINNGLDKLVAKNRTDYINLVRLYSNKEELIKLKKEMYDMKFFNREEFMENYEKLMSHVMKK